MKSRHKQDYFKNYYRRPEVERKRIERKRRFLIFIRDYKKDKSCVECGWKENPQLLEFHHRDPSNKRFGIPQMTNCNFQKIMEEISKCDLLCLNCHMVRHYPNRIKL